MEFKFLIDEIYLSSLFANIEDNYSEIEWFADLKNNIPSQLGTVYITRDLLSKTFSGVSNAEIFFPTKKKARDLALKFQLAQQIHYRKYSASDYADANCHDAPEDFPTFILNNNGVSLITAFNYENEVWWNNAMFISTYSMGKNALECTRTIISNYTDCPDDEFRTVVPVLFPKIYIHWSNRIKLENFNISPIPMKWIVESLSYLNDYAVEDYRKNPAQFMAEALKKGVNLSPESTKTRKADRMMKEREIQIDGSPICCEWHFKYSKTNGGRIHFHFGYDVGEKEKIKTLGFPIVGIFVQHLSID